MGTRIAQLSAAVIGLLMAAPSGCSIATETQDTLEPLEPPPGQTTPRVPASTTTTSSPTSTSTTASTTEQQLPTGDWEGEERFDVGRIDSVTTASGHQAIRFDRYTYQHPRLGPLDAPALRDEPVAYWYQSPPYVNYLPRLRTFVLDPDVTILVLEQESRPERCGGDPQPEPSWRTVDIDYLGTPEARRQFASLTYSRDGLVTRIRFTRGC